MNPSAMDGVTLLLLKGSHLYHAHDDGGDGDDDDHDDDDNVNYEIFPLFPTRCYIKSSLTGPLIEFPGTESGPKPCSKTSASTPKSEIDNGKRKATMPKKKGLASERCIVEKDTNYAGNDIFPTVNGELMDNGVMMTNDPPLDCAKLCLKTDGCFFWTIARGFHCFLKSSDSGRRSQGNFESGNKACAYEKHI